MPAEAQRCPRNGARATARSMNHQKPAAVLNAIR
jgi:hypothetical protein